MFLRNFRWLRCDRFGWFWVVLGVCKWFEMASGGVSRFRVVCYFSSYEMKTIFHLFRKIFRHQKLTQPWECALKHEISAKLFEFRCSYCNKKKIWAKKFEFRFSVYKKHKMALWVHRLSLNIKMFWHLVDVITAAVIFFSLIISLFFIHFTFPNLFLLLSRGQIFSYLFHE